MFALMMFALVAGLFVVANLLNASENQQVKKARDDAEKDQVRNAKQQVSAVDMTPPILVGSSSTVVKASESVVKAEATVVKVSESSFKTELQLEGSKVTRKGTANDPARWACFKTFFGEGHVSAPQAVRSTDPQRLATAQRLREEAVAEAAAARKAEVKRAKKYQARVKKMLEEAAEAAAEIAMLEHHLREDGVTV